MPIRSGLQKLRTNVGLVLKPRAARPLDSPAMEPPDALQRDQGSEAPNASASRPSAIFRHVEEGIPTGMNSKSRFTDTLQPAAEGGRTAGGKELSGRDADDTDHANDTAQTTAAPVHSNSDARPTATVMPPLAKSGLAAFKWALEIMREVSEPFAPLKAAANGVLNVWDRFDASDDIEKDFDRAARKMQAVNDVLKKYNSRPDMEGSMQSLADVMALVQHHIAHKDDQSRLKRMVHAPSDAQDVVIAIRMLADVADLFVMSATASIDAKLDILLENQQLKELRFVSTALYKAIASSGCIDGSCVQLLSELLNWAMTADDVPPVCFLNGPAGFGKTTVAYTMCTILQGLGALGGSFFCSRDSGIDRRSIRFIFSTLARSLTLVSRPYSEFLARKLQADPGVSDYVPSRQFEVLFSQPQEWNRSDRPGRGTPSTNFKVFVIDALDECDDSDEATYSMLHILRDKVRGRHLRFLIVSRPEPRILKAFSMPSSGWSSIIRFQDVPEDVAMSDVSKYLRRELARCARDHSLHNWPSDDEFRRLELRASGLFIYAATACKFIATLGGDPRKRLSEVVKLGSSGIDPMYGFVLSTALARQTTEERLITLRFLRAVICTLEPLPLQALAQLLQIDEDTLRMTVSVLYSVVHVPEPGSAAPVTTFHASFAEYLLSPERSSEQLWHVDAESVKSFHLDLFVRCVRTMQQGLYFNVSQTGTSYARNEDQPDRQSVADVLRYACIFWMDHLEKAAASLADAEELSTVFPEAFLFWLEVLSIAERTESGLERMERLLHWLRERVTSHRDLAAQDHPTSIKLVSSHRKAVVGSDGVRGRVDGRQNDAALLMGVAEDATVFMRMFDEPIKASAAHIYLSTLMHDGSRYKNVVPHLAWFRCLPKIETDQPRVLPPLIMSDHQQSISSVADSPDGTSVTSGAPHQTIRLWNMESDVAADDPLHVHEDSVESVAFSPDGTRIASGSADKTIRLWDAETGVAIGDPLRGHEDWVRSVAFSPDGTRIASGSWDKTIRLWDAKIIAASGDPLRRHQDSRDNTIRLWNAGTGADLDAPLRVPKDWFISVAFSPDGTRIASGSGDGTIWLRDAQTGAVIGNPLGVHEGPVRSIAFSPDGTRIASGSDDMTMRLWNVDTGAAIGDPLRGHKGWVWSVAFSPDGTKIASGSEDGTIWLWNAETWGAIGDPLRGHEDSVHSVAFSRDGSRIASGSRDKTIRLWDADTGAAIGDPLRGHQDWIWSVAFSPDGTRIVSGSRDKTIRLWVAEAGTAMGGPLQGRGGSASFAPLSPGDARNASGSDDTTIWLQAEDAGVTAPRYVAFSPNVTHSTRVDALIRNGKDPRSAFLLSDDGWLSGPHRELLLWLPREYRRGLWWPRTHAIIGAHPVVLDLSRFAHGEDWTQCYSQHAKDTAHGTHGSVDFAHFNVDAAATDTEME